MSLPKEGQIRFSIVDGRFELDKKLAPLPNWEDTTLPSLSTPSGFDAMVEAIKPVLAVHNQREPEI